MRLLGYVGAAMVLPVAAVFAFGVLSWLFPQERTAPVREAARAAPAPAPARPAAPEAYTSDGAQGACVLSIPPLMNDPGSVEFIGLTTSWSVQPTEAPNRWDVLVPLRAKNRLGALVRETLRCRVQREPAGWRLVGLEALQ